MDSGNFDDWLQPSGSEPLVSEVEPVEERLPIARAIKIRHLYESSYPIDTKNKVLIRSIDSDLNFPSDVKCDLFIHRDISGTVCSIYGLTKTQYSPWKGMTAYYTGKLLMKTDPQSTDPLISLLYKLHKHLTAFHSIGVLVAWHLISINRIRVGFYLHESRVLGSINELNYLHKHLTPEGQYVMKLIVEGRAEKWVDNGSVEVHTQRRRADIDFGAFFKVCEDLRNKSVDVIPDYKLNEERINFSLMPYQKNTVRWMMHRESDDTVDDSLSWIYECNNLSSDPSCFYYPHLAVVTRRKMDQVEQFDFLKSNTLKGGILADEMGLGKTVQMLALISSHRKGIPLETDDLLHPDDDDIPMKHDLPNYSISEQLKMAEKNFLEMRNAKRNAPAIRYDASKFVEGKTIECPRCERLCSASVCGWDFPTNTEEKFLCPNCTSKNIDRKSVKTTLIIVPESLIFQWFTEIGKHCSDEFKVLFYFGVKKNGYLPTHVMEKYDAILTTYDTIRNELDFSSVKSLRTNLRREISAMYLVSSLVHVNFWRVIVDESQVIPQGVTAKLPMMFSNLQGENWWCVTGTPLVRSVADILTLFIFLRLKPFGQPEFFNKRMHTEYLDIFINATDPAKHDLSRVILLQLLTTIMSRKTKKSVEDQMKLPELTEVERKVYFTAVEERQYKDEKERLKEVVESAILRAKDSQRLADLKCRDKVLQELRTLQETVLTGQTSTNAKGYSNFGYDPETVIFRLIHVRKTSIANHLREFMANALGLSGVQLLLENPRAALAVYKHAFENYRKFQKDLGLDELKGRESIKRFLDRMEQEILILTNDAKAPEEYEYDDELSGSSENKEELERIREMTGILRKVAQVCNKYANVAQSAEDSMEANYIGIKNKSNSDDDFLEPPEAKRPRLDEKKTQIEAAIASTSENQGSSEQAKNELVEQLDEKEIERRKKMMMRTLVSNAGDPIEMDATQEAHLMINMYKTQLIYFPDEELHMPMEPIERLCNKFQKIEKDTLEVLRNNLHDLSDIWKINDEKIIDCIGKFFESLGSSNTDDTSALYNNDETLNETVKKDHILNLPYIALYDTIKLKPDYTPNTNSDGTVRFNKHNTKRCMGRCELSWTIDPYAGQECMEIIEVLEKTMEQINRVDREREYVEEEMQLLISFVLKMSDPMIFLDLLVPGREKETEEHEQMMKVLDCRHELIKGSWDEREEVNKYFLIVHPCKLCNVWCKLHSVGFDAGLASFHGWPKEKSSVLEFASYLVDRFTLIRREATDFTKTCLRPFFERIEDFTKVLRQTVLIIVELTDRFNELRVAQSLMTDNLLEKIRHESVESARNISADTFIRKRNRSHMLIEKEIKDLRYLINLMEQQLTGEKDDFDECPICKFDLDAFMVFTCGHRVCPECFDRLKQIANEEVLRRDTIRTSTDIIKCPTCRINNSKRQIMLACRGDTAESSVIPGVVLSAKLSCAVQLIRDLLRENSSNKIILFTSFEPGNSSVWQYLQKILKAGNLPFASASRANFGKNILDFEISTETKILLCSISMCANGLNMTGANHIIFLDPPHLQSVLYQAIGRINRFGQKRAMSVHHLMVEGSLDIELREIAKTNRGKDERKGWTVGDIRGMFDITLTED